MQTYTLTNLLNPSSFTLSNVTVTDGIYTFATGTTATISQSLTYPTVGHKYYGRVYQKVPAGTTTSDGRFEMFIGDEYRVKNIAFCHFNDAVKDNAWHLHSNIDYFTSLIYGTYILRNFSVNATNPVYRKEHMIIDLTGCFGEGNEPAQTWCDANIPYFTGTTTITLSEIKLRIKYNDNYIINDLDVLTPQTKILGCSNKNMASDLELEIYSE